MARVWICDLNYTRKYWEAVERAEQGGQKPPSRWQVSWYDNTGTRTTETIADKAQAEARQSEIERTLQDRTNVDPAAAEVTFTEVADEWLDARRDLRTSA
jgi:hypothetical protein